MSETKTEQACTHINYAWTEDDGQGYLVNLPNTEVNCRFLNRVTHAEDRIRELETEMPDPQKVQALKDYVTKELKYALSSLIHGEPVRAALEIDHLIQRLKTAFEK